MLYLDHFIVGPACRIAHVAHAKETVQLRRDGRKPGIDPQAEVMGAGGVDGKPNPKGDRYQKHDVHDVQERRAGPGRPFVRAGRFRHDSLITIIKFIQCALLA